MPPKGKGKAKSTDDDVDLDSFLAEAAAQVGAAQIQSKPPPAEIIPGDEGSDDDSGPDDGAAKKDKKKKKKKGKKEPGAEKAAEPAKPLTAAGKAILERQRLIAEEEARIKKIQEEEDRRIREEEEKEEAERRAIETEKERKRKLKQDKVDAQKAAGTYMTKAEKEKAQKTAARLEALKAAGMISDELLDKAKLGQGEGAPKSKAEMYAAPKKKNAVFKAPEPEPEPVKAATESACEWDEDDWEVKDLSAGLQDALKASLEIEDELELDTRAEQDRLKLLGIERAKRDELERLRRLEEEKERAEMERKEREAAMKKESSRKRRTERDAVARAARTPENLRSPISCIMGHVDTGKTKLLDKIRHTNVQEGEAGGITQQIGATQFSKETLLTQTQALRDDADADSRVNFDIKLPGLLVIDTPGHESFSNLRSRGSSLCDVAILVIDLMHGLEQQTIESLNMLRKRKTPFVVALNKVDRCYGWKTFPDSPIRRALAGQDDNCKSEFDDRASRAILALNEQGLNAKLYWENDDPLHTVSLVPTSAVTGEGVPDLIMMVIKLTQELQQEKLMYMNVLQVS